MRKIKASLYGTNKTTGYTYAHCMYMSQAKFLFDSAHCMLQMYMTLCVVECIALCLINTGNIMIKCW